MKRLFAFAFVCLFSLSISGCFKGAENALVEMAILKEKACACKDKACGDSVMTEFEQWFGENEHVAASPEQEAQAEKLGFDLGFCLGAIGVDPNRFTALEQ